MGTKAAGLKFSQFHAAIKLGQTASVTQPGNADRFEGKVTVVSPAADPNTTTVQVWIQIDNPGERLKPGSAVHAAIATEVFKAASVVPVAAILPANPARYSASRVIRPRIEGTRP